jgi:hypothetical protein
MEQKTSDMFLYLNFISPWSTKLHVIDFFCCRQVCKAWRQALTKKEQDQLIRDTLKGYPIKYAREFCIGLEQLAARYTGDARVETAAQSITTKGFLDYYRALFYNEGQSWQYQQYCDLQGYILIPLDNFPHSPENQLGFSAVSFQVDPGVRLHAVFSDGGEIIFNFISEPTDQMRTLRYDLFEMPLVFTQGRLRNDHFAISSTTPFTLHIVEEPINTAPYSFKYNNIVFDSIFYLTKLDFVSEFGLCNIYRNLPSAGTGGLMWNKMGLSSLGHLSD